MKIPIKPDILYILTIYHIFNREEKTPTSTDSTLFLSKSTSFTSCSAYQYMAWVAVNSDLPELQPSHTCVLKADVHHHYPRLNSPMGPFKVHVVTSSMYMRKK